MEHEDKRQLKKNIKNKKSIKIVEKKDKIAQNSSIRSLQNAENIHSNSYSISSTKSPIVKEKKVLMLGWEFPPVINGGLGVACLGLSKALSKFVDLTVILPKSDPTFIVENVELIGLNNIELRKILKQDTYNSEEKKDFIAEQLEEPQDVNHSSEISGPRKEVILHNYKQDGVPESEQGKEGEQNEILTEYDTFAKTEYVDIQIDPYFHSTKSSKDTADEDSYLQNLTTRLSKKITEEHNSNVDNLATKAGMGEGEEGVLDEDNPAKPVAASRNDESVFAYSVNSTEENLEEKDNRGNQQKQKETVQEDDLIIEKFLHAFRDGELYGEDVIQKVILYSKYVLKLAAQKEFDIIYAHDWMTFLAGIEVKAKTGKPLALHVHALDYDRGGPDSKGWIFELEKYAMENADLIMPVSNYTASVIAGHYGINPDKVFAVHNGADHVDVFKEEKAFPEKLVLFLGRVTGQKGPEFFLEVASKVFERYPKVRFVVAGTGDKLKRLIETGSYRQIGHKFHFTGFLRKEKVHQLLAMTDVYCMPSVSEPFGLSALEAAQFGVPMVISKQSGVAEVLNGALSADYWDVDLMAEHIISLLKSKRISSRVVKQCNEDMKFLTWDIAAEKIYNNFMKVLG